MRVPKLTQNGAKNHNQHTRMNQAIIITIGDELLIGQVVDTNSARIAQQLNKIGIGVLERVAVSDDKEHIKTSVENALAKSNIVILTGGLGPTKDDLTKDALNEFFGGALVVNEDVLNDVKEFFAKVKRPLLESNIKQAEVPSACKALRNKLGTAPGMWFDRDDKIVVSLPGVPFEMQAMMETSVLPELKKRFHQGGAIVHKTLMTCGIGESFLAEKIKDWENALPPHIKLAYLPNMMLVRLRLTAVGTDEEQLKREVETQVNAVLPLIEEYVYGTDEISLEETIGVMLKEKDAFVSTAESCTGGLIAHKMSGVQGSSEWFKGSIVSYAEEIKTTQLKVPKAIIDKHGVVSKQVAKRMAKRIAKKFGTQYGIGVTGWADPKTTPHDETPGLIWIGWWDGDRATAKSYVFPRNRQQNIEMATVMALDGLRKILTKPAEG